MITSVPILADVTVQDTEHRFSNLNLGFDLLADPDYYLVIASTLTFYLANPF